MAEGWFEPRADLAIAGQRVSADELRERRDSAAALLTGVRVLAVDSTPSIDTIAVLLAALAVGVPAVPLSPDAGPREREHILRDSGADAHWSDGALRSVSVATAVRPHADLILYTSGTTGAPKGVPITTASMVSCIDSLAEAWQWNPDDVLAHGLPLHHVHGLVLGVLGPLHVGSALVHTGRPTPEAYAEAAASLYFGVPTVWGRIASSPTAARALAKARLLVSGSAALPRPVHTALSELAGQAPVERYGMTETLITLSARAADPRRPGTVGLPLSGVHTRLVGDDGALVPHDGQTLGQLEVRGPGLFTGYLHQPEATQASFTSDGWFRTGDIATVAPDGVHRIVGRAATDLIKSGGYRIGAGEVEDALLAHPSVREAAVIGVADDDLGQRIVAFVVADSSTEADLIAHVGAQLSWHKRPRAVVFVDELPRNALGKVEKARLNP